MRRSFVCALTLVLQPALQVGLVLDAVNMMESRSGGGSAFCAPEITSDEVTDVVTKHLKRHPARWDSPAATLVVQALAQAFPCNAKSD
jgi:hypothetical protein